MGALPETETLWLSHPEREDHGFCAPALALSFLNEEEPPHSIQIQQSLSPLS